MAALKQREQEVAAARPKREADRAAAIVKAKTTLEAYQKEIAPRLAAEEKQCAIRIQQADAALKQQEEKLAPKLADWEKAQAITSEWVALKPTDLKASANNIKLELQPDLSVFASGGPNRTNYVITAETELKGITGIRLELLADDRLPGKVPAGRPTGTSSSPSSK